MNDLGIRYAHYDDPETRRRALIYARGDYQRRALEGRVRWDGGPGAWTEERAESLEGLLDRLRRAGFCCRARGYHSMHISRDADDRQSFVDALREGTVGVAA